MDWSLSQRIATKILLNTCSLPVNDTELTPPPPVVPAPATNDPAVLLRYLEAHEPVKLALARDFPLVVHKLVKTAKGIKEMMEEEDEKATLHKGLGWLHYRALAYDALFDYC